LLQWFLFFLNQQHYRYFRFNTFPDWNPEQKKHHDSETDTLFLCWKITDVGFLQERNRINFKSLNDSYGWGNSGFSLMALPLPSSEPD